MVQADAGASRPRRDRGNIRELLLESAIIEFGERGYEGASTRSIAERIDAHQPQINYHFASKEELWRATVDVLFEELDAHLAEADVADADAFARMIHSLVEFSAARPQLHQIMSHEATTPTDRLAWVTKTHVRPRYEGLRMVWTQLQAMGVAAPIDPDLLHYVLVGGASLPYLNIAEARLLLDEDPSSPETIERHARGLVATLLPGLDSGGNI